MPFAMKQENRQQVPLLCVFFGIAGSLLLLANLRDGATSLDSRLPPSDVTYFSLRDVLSSQRRRVLLTTSILNEEEPIPDLFPLQTLDYVGFLCAIVGLILAAGAGIGGGGILVPIFILIFEFPIKHSIPLASVTVLGGAIANNALNARKRHPDHPGRPAIDWDLIIQLEPMTIAGALIGTDLNDVLPDVVLVVMLFLLLSITAYKTLQKAHILHEKETEELAKASQHETDNLLTNEKNYGSTLGQHDLENNNTTVDHEEGLAESTKHTFQSAAQLTALFIVVTILNLMKGGPEQGGGGPISLESCGTRCFWMTEVSIMLLIILFASWVRWSLLKRIQSGGPSTSDIDWNENNTILYPSYAIVAGLVAGMFGVGGGIIKGPLMLALGVHPAVASATSACMILFTSSTATISYMIFHLLIYDYAGGCLAVGFLATLVGQTMMSILMKKYKRNSYIAYTIGITVGLSAIAMTFESVVAIFD